MKLRIDSFFNIALATLLLLPVTANALTIGGAVRQPLNLGITDLERFGAVEVRATDLSSKKQFGGVFSYRGVPLRNLLQTAAISKDGPGFNKATDLAIAIRNREGKTVTLSWGEVFYRNPANAVIAFSAAPVIPHHAKGCNECHGAEVYQPVLDQLSRTVALPKLVMADDFYADRNLEDIVNIEVIDLQQRDGIKPVDRNAPTEQFTMTGLDGKSSEITTLAGLPTLTVDYREVGDGRGFHGTDRFTGVPLRSLLERIDPGNAMDRAVLVTSTDGYRSLLSFGELFLSPLGGRIIVSEHKGNYAGGKKKFTLVLPDDLAADRMVKTINRVEIVSLLVDPKVYIISLGCGDPRLITLEAISAMGKADAFIAPEGMAKQYAHYLGSKPILFDPMLNYEPFFRRKNPGLGPAEAKKKLEAQRAADMQKIRDALAAGKSLALLDHGDPTIFGGWQHWIEPEVQGRFEVVTGVSAYNAANAMFANDKIFSGISAFSAASHNNLLCNRGSGILTAPASLVANEGLLKAVAASGDTMAIFMGLGELKTLVPLLKKYYPKNAPVAIAFNAGMAKESRIVKTTLNELEATTAKQGERMMGMIYIGDCLK